VQDKDYNSNKEERYLKHNDSNKKKLMEKSMMSLLWQILLDPQFIEKNFN